jgi:hypothetical protein
MDDEIIDKIKLIEEELNKTKEENKKLQDELNETKEHLKNIPHLNEIRLTMKITKKNYLKK